MNVTYDVDNAGASSGSNAEMTKEMEGGKNVSCLPETTALKSQT